MPEPTSDQQQQPTLPPEIIEHARQEALAELFPGKGFTTLDQAKQSVLNQQNSASALEGQLRELATSQADINQRLSMSQQAQQANSYDPFARLTTENFIPADVLRDAIRSEARQLVQSELTPFFSTIQARGSVSQAYPVYQQHESEIMAIIAKDEGLKSAMQTNPAMALELATLRFKSTLPASSVASDKEVVDGSIPGQGSGSVNRTTPVNDDEGMRAALLAAQRGDERAVYNWQFRNSKPILPPHMQQ